MSAAAAAAGPDVPSDWWKATVVYQIYPRSFADSDGDGIGDLRGIIAHLDHLSALGVGVVWLSPIYRSPMDDNGYDISDYQDVDQLFGTLADLDELLAQAHQRGIRVVMDLVVNHTSDEHAWFVASRSSRDDAKRDWYIWRDPRPGHVGGEPGAEPCNWGSAFSGSAWQWEPDTGQYFLHLFSPRQPDLNWENPQVRDAVYTMMRWWLDRGVDGFRMDVINLISKGTDFPDGPVPPGGLYANRVDTVAGGERLEEFLQEMHAAVFADRPNGLLTVGETPGVTIEAARELTDPANHELDMVFQFEHVNLDSGPGGKWDLRPLRMVDLKANLAAWQEGLAERGWNSLYWDNHDQARAVSRFGDDSPDHRVASAKALATILHLHRGTPYVYQGEELGMTNHPFGGIEDFQDLESVNYFRQATAYGSDADLVLHALRAKSRDNARTPMQWDGSAQAGFTTGTPWLAVNPNHAEINAAAQVDDPDSVFGHYRRLVELRRDEPVVAHGGFTLLLPDDERVWAFERSLDEVRLLVVANCSSDDDVRASVPDEAGWAAAEVVMSSGPPYAGDVAGQFVLGPWEARILRR